MSAEKRLARALQAKVPGLAYQSALQFVRSGEAPTLALAAALREVLDERRATPANDAASPAAPGDTPGTAAPPGDTPGTPYADDFPVSPCPACEITTTCSRHRRENP